MNRTTNVSFRVSLPRLAAATLTLALALSAIAQDFDISWHTIDGGGEMFSIGGDFELSGSIGQPDAGALIWGNEPFPQH